MGFRFFRRIKIAPGLRMNLSRSGVSASVGRRGAWFTIGPRGTRETVGIPGTGLSYIEEQRVTAPHDESTSTPAQPVRKTPARSLGWLIVILIGALAVILALLFSP
jgi:hypothetical protein